MDNYIYHVELEGFNDGMPYYKDSFMLLEEAKDFASECRKRHPLVRFRIIKIIEDFSN